MNVTRTNITGSEPITTAEAKDWCYVTGSNWDNLIDTLITTVREHIENETWRAIIEAEYEYRLDEFPEDEIEIPKPPIKSINTIEYVDTDGATQQITDYDADTSAEYGRIQRADGKTWPETDDVYNAVTITFTAGYDTVPEPLTIAMRLMIKHFFDNRESVVVGQAGTIDTKEVPQTAELLMNRYSARTYQ